MLSRDRWWAHFHNSQYIQCHSNTFWKFENRFCWLIWPIHILHAVAAAVAAVVVHSAYVCAQNITRIVQKRNGTSGEPSRLINICFFYINSHNESKMRSSGRKGSINLKPAPHTHTNETLEMARNSIEWLLIKYKRRETK